MKKKSALPNKIFSWLVLYVRTLEVVHFIARVVFILQVLTLFFGAMLVQIQPGSKYYIGTPLSKYVLYTGILAVSSFGFLYYFYSLRIYRGGYGLLGGLLYLSAYCAGVLFGFTLCEFLYGYILSNTCAWVVAIAPLLPVLLMFQKIQRFTNKKGTFVQASS